MYFSVFLSPLTQFRNFVSDNQKNWGKNREYDDCQFVKKTEGKKSRAPNQKNIRELREGSKFRKFVKSSPEVKPKLESGSLEKFVKWKRVKKF